MNNIPTLALLLAQADLETVISDGTTTIMSVSLIICICGIIAGGFSLMRGEITFAIYILLGSLTIGGAVAIANAFFSLAGVN